VHSITILAAALAALIHLWIFAMESLWFMRPSVHQRFGLATEEQARVVRSFAYNQGFYNLFLAVGVIIGLALLVTGDFATARALVLFACSSMVAAGIVLVTHNRRFARAAAIQAGPPLVAIVTMVIWDFI
jgi:putative membrane protein